MTTNANYGQRWPLLGVVMLKIVNRAVLNNSKTGFPCSKRRRSRIGALLVLVYDCVPLLSAVEALFSSSSFWPHRYRLETLWADLETRQAPETNSSFESDSVASVSALTSNASFAGRQ